MQLGSAMNWKAFVAFLTLTLISHAPQAQKADESDRKRKVTLIVFKDDSGSMVNHLKQVRELSDRLVKALERTDCMELNLAVVAQSQFENGLRDLLVYGRIEALAKEGSHGIDTGPDRYIRLERMSDLERFKARIVHGSQYGVEEAMVAHVSETIVRESDFLRKSDAVAALVVTDVAVGSDQIKSDDLHLDRIRRALGKTRFVAFALGMDSSAEKVSCLPDFPKACFEDMAARLSGSKREQNPDLAPENLGIGFDEAFLTLQANGVTYSSLARSCSDRYNSALPDLLQKFSIKSGGQFADICKPKAAEIADQMAESILKAAQCQFLM